MCLLLVRMYEKRLKQYTNGELVSAVLSLQSVSITRT
jgi:hypothetical protein